MASTDSAALMVIIAAYTLASLVLIGRGVFCGWLCPFGALQELLGQLSRALGVPQWNPAPALEKRLWMGKYIAAATVLVVVQTGLDPTATAKALPVRRAAAAPCTPADTSSQGAARSLRPMGSSSPAAA
jgi:hypothetical protein